MNDFLARSSSLRKSFKVGAQAGMSARVQVVETGPRDLQPHRENCGDREAGEKLRGAEEGLGIQLHLLHLQK